MKSEWSRCAIWNGLSTQQTYFTGDVSGEVAVGAEFETAGVLGSVVDDVNVPRLQIARTTDVTERRTNLLISGPISFIEFLPMCFSEQ